MPTVPNSYPIDPSMHRGEVILHEAHEHGNNDGTVTLTHALPGERKAVLLEAPGEDIRSVPIENGGIRVMVFVAVCSFISFVFMLTATCPVPWYRSSTGDKWTVWKDNRGTWWKDTHCDHKKQIFQAMQSFSVISIVLSLATFIAAVLQLKGAGHMGVTLVFLFYSMSLTLVVWALGVHQYHKYNCSEEPRFSDGVNRLDAGFALTVISFILLFFAIFVLVCYCLQVYRLPQLWHHKFRSGALVFALVVGVCLLITCVGSAFTLWETVTEDFKIKFTFWRAELYNPTNTLSVFISLEDSLCGNSIELFKASRAFAIISACLLFVTLLVAVASVYHRRYKMITIAFSGFSWVTLLICWVVILSARGNDCEGLEEIVLDKFVITEGLGMIISAWCFMTVAPIFYFFKG